ncbi:putative Heat shock protein 70 family [Helianthus annuus]|uniref:Heat shock protein 70 family n=1 Tax=Helianthus annuus TaxID=4232 RepID=A0A251URG0_HELAN|nr:putative Heat shock protein 70 family [Helianthus annuus]KAJ0569834.1 putative Heat shock protein 70kD domain superfamily [Helianthus annuus]KAJ0584156.1 putative Heat shock protein 70kD domain superfamily [Helianthus annuus]KAJ0749825.1 putative Heat shock protein 70kD domain superfamily [Helianthus annuus]KAJ0918469.1 putative Heat shock protein 70 family [Helianthus annuus]
MNYILQRKESLLKLTSSQKKTRKKVTPDSVVYQTEKQLKGLGDKVPAYVKEKLEAKLGELKVAISDGCFGLVCRLLRFGIGLRRFCWDRLITRLELICGLSVVFSLKCEEDKLCFLVIRSSNNYFIYSGYSEYQQRRCGQVSAA